MNSQSEIWKNVLDFKEIYLVSNLGRVKSIQRQVNCGLGRSRSVQERILRQGCTKQRYRHICLYKGDKRYTVSVHRLVAKAFLPNPNNLPEVNHIDGNPENNHVSNLEWCNRSYNIKDSWKRTDRTKRGTRGKKVKAINLKTNIESIYDNSLVASKNLNIDNAYISMVANHKRRQAKGYKFEFI